MIGSFRFVPTLFDRVGIPRPGLLGIVCLNHPEQGCVSVLLNRCRPLGVWQHDCRGRRFGIALETDEIESLSLPWW